MFISSDTNIWIDFFEVNHLDHPFRLENEYYISQRAYKDEMLKSEEMREALLLQGLKLTEIDDDEFSLAMSFREKYHALTTYDAFALSIAKTRKWILLTGDRPLRNAAEKESVECHGVIWIYDELKSAEKISSEEYRSAICDLIDAVQNGQCRLPLDELRKRRDL